MNLQEIQDRVASVLASTPSVDDINALHKEILGYKPKGALRTLRHELYTQINSAAKRSPEKAALKATINQLSEVEDSIAEAIDAARMEAKDRARAAKEAAEAQEHSA